MTLRVENRKLQSLGESNHTLDIADPIILTGPNSKWSYFKILAHKTTGFAIPLQQKEYHIYLKSLIVNVDSEKLDGTCYYFL